MNFVLRMAYREWRASWRRLIFFFCCVAIGVGGIVALALLLGRQLGIDVGRRCGEQRLVVEAWVARVGVAEARPADGVGLYRGAVRTADAKDDACHVGLLCGYAPRGWWSARRASIGRGAAQGKGRVGRDGDGRSGGGVQTGDLCLHLVGDCDEFTDADGLFAQVGMDSA